jgi:hypothetical protein
MEEYPKMICAREFVLVDEEGSPRANWAIDDGGQAAISFLDRDGNGKLLVGVGKDGLAVIALKAAKDFPSTLITIDKNGDFKFACLDESGNNQFQITVPANGSTVQLGLGGNPPAVLLSAINGKGEIYKA